jgi:UDPglucose 6-dehydrogenase
MLATKISFMNEIARLCDVAGGDAEHVRLAVGSDERIGMQFLYPGLGFGGSCFPKDLRALVHTGEELGVDLAVARAAVAANEGPVTFLLRHMEGDLGGLKDKLIAVWGLAFKPRTDDVREAPALRLIKEVVKRGGKVQATDPEALHTARERLIAAGVMDHVKLVDSEYAACEGADALVLATEWSEYRSPDLPRIKSAMRGRHVFDGRNVLVPGAVVDAGLVYRGMGRPQRGN